MLLHVYSSNYAYTISNKWDPKVIIIEMDEGDSQAYFLGNANKRLVFSSQMSQGTDNSFLGNPLPNENSIDKSLDVRLLSQLDFFTPAVRIQVWNGLLYSSTKNHHLSYLSLRVIQQIILAYLERLLRKPPNQDLDLFLNERLGLVLVLNGINK